MSDVLGPNSFNGLVLLAAAALASLLGLLLTLGLALAWAVGRSPARRQRALAALRVTLANSVAVGLLFWAMEDLDLFGPRLPAWIDWLGAAWLVAFAAISAMMLLCSSARSSGRSSPQETHR